MKTLKRILIVVAIGCVIYFSSIGRRDFYSLLDFFSNLIQVIADNYLKK